MVCMPAQHALHGAGTALPGMHCCMPSLQAPWACPDPLCLDQLSASQLGL
jgi:hypothetical protein